MPATDAFPKVQITVPETSTAYEMWVAVWNNRGRGTVMLGAPTLEELADRWLQLTHLDIDRSICQHVVLTHHQRARLADAVSEKS